MSMNDTFFYSDSIVELSIILSLMVLLIVISSSVSEGGKDHNTAQVPITAQDTSHRSSNS